MAREKLASQDGMSPECGHGTWAIANVSRWVCAKASTKFDAPGTLSDAGRFPPVEIPESTTEQPWTPVDRETAMFLLERNDPNFGDMDGGLRAWFTEWPGKEKGLPCARNQKVLEQIRAIEEGRERPVELVMRIQQRNRHPLLRGDAQQRVNAAVIPDESASPEQLAAVVKAHNLGHLIAPTMPHAKRLERVRGALLDRFMSNKVTASPADVAEAAASVPAPVMPEPPKNAAKQGAGAAQKA